MTKKELQSIWDAALIRGWRDDIKMNKVFSRFCAELRFLGFEGIPGKQETAYKTAIENRQYTLSLGLKRTTGYSGIPARAFIARNLAVISNILWDGKLSDKELVRRLADSDIDCKLDAAAKAAELEDHARRASVRRTAIGNAAARQNYRLRQGGNCTDWKQTKAVRSK